MTLLAPVLPPGKEPPTMSRGKNCITCGSDAWLERFKKRNGKTFGPYYNCRQCAVSRSRRWAKENPLAAVLSYIQARCRKNDIPFDLDESDLVVPVLCPVLGIILKGFGPGRVQLSDDSATVDRIIPEKGYIKGNVAVISWRANRMKNDGTAAELRALADWLEYQVGGF